VSQAGFAHFLEGGQQTLAVSGTKALEDLEKVVEAATEDRVFLVAVLERTSQKSNCFWHIGMRCGPTTCLLSLEGVPHDQSEI